MSEWIARRLDELGLIVTGSTPPARHPEWFGEDVDFITPSDIQDGIRRALPQRRLSAAGKNHMRSRVLPKDSVCFVCIGATIGKLCLTIGDSVSNQQINSIVPNQHNDARFIYYLLCQEAPRIARTAGGAATPILNKSAFAATRVTVPRLPVQRRIADILGSLDDLIENNRRRVALLEQMAQTVYREWFVYYRYPGHENAPIASWPVNPVPEGWREEALTGRTPFRLSKLRVQQYTGVKMYIATADCSGFHRLSGGEYIEFKSLPTRAQFEPQAETVWFARMAGYSKVLALPEASEQIDRLVLSSGFACLECDEGWLSFVLATVLNETFEPIKARYATGATQVSLTDAGAKKIPWLIPTTPIVKAFETNVRPMYLEALQLLSAIEAASQLRDLLLPKIVLGEIDVHQLNLDALMEALA